MKLNRILVPTDFSENSFQAIEFAKQIIDPDFGAIDLMYVVHGQRFFVNKNERVNLPLHKGSNVYPTSLENMYDQLMAIGIDKIGEKYMGSMHLWVGSTVHDAVCEQAAAGNYDLVLMSNKGSQNTQLFRGLNSEKVIRHSTVPVFTIHENYEEQFKNICVPLDLSQLSYQALPIAFKLADIFNSNITIFHAVEHYETDSRFLPYNDPMTFNNMLHNEILSKISQYFEQNEQHKVTLVRDKNNKDEVLVRFGSDSSKSLKLNVVINQGASAHYEIKNYANENSDLLVMTVIGRCDFACPFIGQTADEVLQNLVIPSLTVWPSESIKYELENNWNSETAYKDSKTREYHQVLPFSA